jgi:hypothetical protein
VKAGGLTVRNSFSVLLDRILMCPIGIQAQDSLQKCIGEFGIEKFHRPAFIPLAVKTNQQQKGEK